MIFLIIQSYLEIIFMYVDVHELVKEHGFLQLWCDKYSYEYDLSFGWAVVCQNGDTHFLCGIIIFLLLQS